MTVGYFSSYDRGLECLLDMWPEIRKQAPKATLDIYYGWGSYDEIHRGNPERMKWKWTMIRKLHALKEHGVTEHGRVSHTELAKAMKKIKVWAYPTEFTEIHCITALKAQEAGCIPVVTKVAALAETAAAGHLIDADDIYSNSSAQKQFIDEVVKALGSKEKVKPVPGVSWEDVAFRWSEACDLGV